MWEFISFILFGVVSFFVGGGVIATHAVKRAVEIGRFEHRGVWYLVAREKDQ
jgi:hypothetical protein